jgi:hypothetical protein
MMLRETFGKFAELLRTARRSSGDLTEYGLGCGRAGRLGARGLVTLALAAGLTDEDRRANLLASAPSETEPDR